MSENLRAKISLLEEKVRLLEIENKDWADRAEDIFLFAVTAENISELTDEKEIFESVLEKISILKRIPYCAFGVLENGKLKIEYDYYIYSENNRDVKISIESAGLLI